MPVQVRFAAHGDIETLVSMRSALWPDGPREEHDAEVRAIVGGKPRGSLPLVTLVAEVGGEVVGFAEVWACPGRTSMGAIRAGP